MEGSAAQRGASGNVDATAAPSAVLPLPLPIPAAVVAAAAPSAGPGQQAGPQAMAEQQQAPPAAVLRQVSLNLAASPADLKVCWGGGGGGGYRAMQRLLFELPR